MCVIFIHFCVIIKFIFLFRKHNFIDVEHTKKKKKIKPTYHAMEINFTIHKLIFLYKSDQLNVVWVKSPKKKSKPKARSTLSHHIYM